MENKIYFGCTDPYGDNEPEVIFHKHILPILKKNKVKESDIEKITYRIAEMCELSYANGMTSEAFNRSENE